MDSVFLNFSLVFGLAVLAGLLLRFLRQPVFLGYVLVGLLSSLFFSTKIKPETFSLLSSSGIMLLLFLVGLEMNVSEVKKLGPRVLAVSFGQLIITFILFLLVFFGFGLSLTFSSILAIAITFSSTIIVVKLLSEKHDLESLYGKVSVGILLIQDVAAIVLLLFISDKGGENSLWLLLFKIFLLVAISVFASLRIMPKLLHRLSGSADELILFSLAWCFLFASFVSSKYIGLSVEVGGFLAGLALSGSFEHHHIVNKIKPIRDFFLTIFFVVLGLSIDLSKTALLPAFYLSAAILLVKPIVVWVIMRLLGYKQRVAFITGLFIGQISEFSFILISMASNLGYLTGSQLALVSSSGIITMVVSAYLIVNHDFVYRLVRPLLDRIWPDRPDDVRQEKGEKLSGHVVLFGCHRMGGGILSHLESRGETVLVVDFDPEIVAELARRGKSVIYADAADIDSYDQFGLDKAKLIISTVRDVKDSLELLQEAKKRKIEAPVVVEAESGEEARVLYKAGAAYVVYPHFVGGLHIGDLIKRGLVKKEDFHYYKKAQQEAMKGVFGQ